ncbi:DUF2225 domain-containing protein [Paenibacillus sp. N1-5-1-14]|uniref:DUF2225 domain-containing protein n=1 Tax=Paenibacillus radicibacter TaxID=2972488 RepID=UPI0021597A5B|nr:DUF2225 domain-containing protein [Paenibacillus radicibacter]MCR8645323.1 DUF2225 domain-containing protein [Paenibacillus radicibacter]
MIKELNIDPLYQITVRCQHCMHTFETSRVRPSFKKGIQTDSDFCVHYKDNNPDFYVVRVCPNCGYSFSENFSEKLTDSQREAIASKITVNWTTRDFGGKRDWDTALHTYKLALLCAQIKSEKERVIAGLLHHIAWLHRYQGNKEEELRFLQYALDAYISVYETEGTEINNARLMYLMGEIHRRLGQYVDAVKWFSRVINDKRIMDSAMIAKSREQWVVTREDMVAARLELPEEMQEQAK